MPGEKSSPLSRQWTLLQSLAAHHYGLTIKEMAAEHGVTTKTIGRDLEKFQEVGFPVSVCQTSEHGCQHWRLDSDAKLIPLNLAWDEAIALYLGRRLLDPLAGTPIGASVQRAFRKIRATLGKRALDHLEKMSGAFHNTRFGASDYFGKSEMIDQLIIAIEDRVATLITYQSLSATEPVTYDVAPYGLVFHNHSLYLVAYSSDHDEIRVFKVDRIEHVDPPDRENLKFLLPDDFDLQRYFAHSFGVFPGNGSLRAVRVRFAADVARVVSEGQWHASQLLTPQRDGSLIGEFQLADLHEFQSWILSFGSKAIVLEPDELREEIAEEYRRALSQTEAAI